MGRLTVSPRWGRLPRSSPWERAPPHERSLWRSLSFSRSCPDWKWGQQDWKSQQRKRMCVQLYLSPSAIKKKTSVGPPCKVSLNLFRFCGVVIASVCARFINNSSCSCDPGASCFFPLTGQTARWCHPLPLAFAWMCGAGVGGPVVPGEQSLGASEEGPGRPPPGPHRVGDILSHRSRQPL